MTVLYFIFGFCVLFQIVVWSVYFVRTTKKERKEVNEQVKAKMRKKYPLGARKPQYTVFPLSLYNQPPAYYKKYDILLKLHKLLQKT